jgi:hypothetical protein
MQVAPARLHDPIAIQHSTLPTAWYSILGVPVSVASNVAAALDRVDESYAAFRATPGESERTLAFRLQRLDDGITYLVSDPASAAHWPTYDGALLDLFDRLVHTLLERLLAQGIYVIHAGAVVYDGRALLLAGRSGHGKTTLVLGLLRRGLELLSDEFAVVEPATRQIVPYRRSLHIRPGTPDLIPELRFLHDLPRHHLGGGIEWAVAPHDLERAFPGCLGRAAPLRYVLLLAGAPCADGSPAITPVPAALAALELLRSTWAASVNFEGGLNRMSWLLDGVPCARLRVGALEATLDQVAAWLEADHG